VDGICEGGEKADGWLGIGLGLLQLAARSRSILSSSSTSRLLIVRSICVCKLNVS